LLDARGRSAAGAPAPRAIHRAAVLGEDRLRLAAVTPRLPALGRGLSTSPARWLDNGCFEQVAHDLRAIGRALAERQPDPSAVIFDARTLQSTPESGGRAGFDGYKKKHGCKVHAAVDTLGHLLALIVTPADMQERDVAAGLAEQVQEVTGGSVKAAFVDQGYTGAATEADVARRGRGTDRGQAPRGEDGVRAAAPAMGGRADVRLAGPVPAAGP
jgi:hypothetical protein